ncbi:MULTISPECIES: hypothetical protein [Planktothrix]|nr:MULTISPECIES: hypothetical protein [Planktothrix]
MIITRKCDRILEKGAIALSCNNCRESDRISSYQCDHFREKVVKSLTSNLLPVKEFTNRSSRVSNGALTCSESAT